MNATFNTWQMATDKNWNFFVGAAILAAGLLLKFGAPVEAIVAGVGLAGLWKWKGAQTLSRGRRSKTSK